jgi:poly-beta-hydroxyalkanoate depolymerase
MDILALEIMFDDLFIDKDVKTESKVWEFADELKSMIDNAAEQYIEMIESLEVK